MLSRSSKALFRIGYNSLKWKYELSNVCCFRQFQARSLICFSQGPKQIGLTRDLSQCRYISTNLRLDQKSIDLKAGPFGCLNLRTIGAVNTEVKCLDPQKYPLQNKVLIYIDSGNDVNLKEEQVNVEQNEDEIRLLIKGTNNQDTTISCTASVPVKFDIHAEVEDDGSVSAERLENDRLYMQTQRGTCRVKSIQTGTAELVSHDGDVNCEGVLQGNSTITTSGTGSVKVHRIQGLTFNVKTKSGNIVAKALYADNTDIETNTGDVHIGSCHRQCSVNVLKHGGVKIDSLDGDLSAHTNNGDISVAYIAKHEDINISTKKGNVDLKLSESLKTKVDIEAAEVSVADDFEMAGSDKQTDTGRTRLTGLLIGGAAIDDKNADLLGDTQRHLLAKTGDGRIDLSSADWFSSLKLAANVE